MKFKKLVSALTLGTVFSTVALGTVSCLDAGTQAEIDQQFLDNWNLDQLESQKERLRFSADSINLIPGGTCEIPILPEEGNITYDYTSSDREIAVVVVKDGIGIVVAQGKVGEATITVRSSNNKIGYLKVNVLNAMEPQEDGNETSDPSNLSDNDIKNAVPQNIIINANDNVSKITVVEGQSVVLKPQLDPANANGLWKIYWQYDELATDAPGYPTTPDYFIFQVKDNPAKTDNSDGDGFVKDGKAMGYKVEVMGLKAGTGRKIVCKSVNVRKEIAVEVVGAEEQEAIPNLTVIGNKGNSVEMTGLSTSYITAVVYPGTDMYYNTVSLTPDICTVTDTQYKSGDMAPITAVNTGTGYIKVTMGRATQIVKVVILKEFIQCVGNVQFSVHAQKDVAGKQNIPKERVVADSIETRIFGTYFPTSANAYYQQKSDSQDEEKMYFRTDTTENGSTAVVDEKQGELKALDNGYFISKDKFKLDRGYWKACAKSYTAINGCALYIGPSSEVGTEDSDSADFKASKGARTNATVFAVHNDDAQSNNANYKSSFETDKEIGIQTTSTSNDNKKSPIFLVLDTGKNDIMTSDGGSDYTQILDTGIYVKKASLITEYKANESQKNVTYVPDMFTDTTTSVTLPTTLVYPVPASETKNKDDNTAVIVTTYRFKKWVKYLVDSKKEDENTITSISNDSGKAVIAVAKFEVTTEEKPIVA